MAKRGELPDPIRLGPGIVRWDLQKIDLLIDSKSTTSGYDDPDIQLLKKVNHG